MRGLIPWGGAMVEKDFDMLLNRMFDRWAPVFRPTTWMEEMGATFAPQANLVETPAAYEVTAELPGMKPEEFSVELKDGALWITGEKQEEHKTEGKTFHRVERRSGKFQRMFELPAAVKEDAILAEFKEGVLKVTVPKAEEVKPKPIAVKT
jgi:HSP20 family protein